MCRRSCLCLALLLAGCGGRDEERVIGEGFVAPATMNLRQDLGPRQPSVATLRHGERVEILGTRRRFVKVRSASGAVGW
ncbi:MAG TPA: SH3 domain-containing protein, partial [Bryobacteraceae bacterium]|nr:SH3 domain-containing protein [Bryobacteraceae bacterium]